MDLVHDDRIKLAILISPKLLNENILLWVGQQLLSVGVIEIIISQIKHFQFFAVAK